MTAWQRIEIAGRPAELFEPPEPPRFGLLFLPDYDSPPPTSSELFTRSLVHHRLACVCPHGGRTFWTDRPDAGFHATLTAERFLLDQLTPIFRKRWSQQERSVGLSGFGIGGQGALRLAFRRPAQFPVVAAIAPSVEFQEWYYADTPLMEMYSSKEHCRQDTALLHIHPTEFPPHIFFCIDPDDREWWRGCDRLHEKLGALGVSHTCDLSTRAGGHAIAYFERMLPAALEFVVHGLERESRRLV